MAVSVRLTEALAVMAAPISRRRAGTGPCPRAMTRALHLRAQEGLHPADQAGLPRAALVGLPPVDLAVLRPVVLMELLPAPPRLASLARGLRVAQAAPLLVVELVGPPRLALVAKAPQRRRF